MTRDQMKVIKGQRRRRSRREQKVQWWVAVTRRFGFNQPSGERHGLLD